MPSPPPKIQRWIDLLAALLRHRYGRSLEELVHDVPAYADIERKDSLQRTFERDKKELRALGVPIQTRQVDDGEKTVYSVKSEEFYLPYLSVVGPQGRSAPRKVSRDGYRALRELTFDADELAALTDAVARAKQLGDPALAADAELALRKLSFDLPVGVSEAANDTVIARPRAAANANALVVLGRALRARKRVTFDYQPPGRDAAESRAVEPYGLFFLGGHWYLTGRDVQRDALRNFRVSRIAALDVSPREATADYDIPDDFVIAEHARSRQAWELGDGAVEEVIVEFHGTHAAVHAARALGTAVKGHEDRRCFRVRRRDSFARWLLSFAGDAIPLEPQPVVDEFRRVARETLAVYEERDTHASPEMVR